MRSLESDHSLGLPDLVLLRTRRLESFEVVGAHLGIGGGGLKAEDEVMRYWLMRDLYGGRYSTVSRVDRNH